MTNPQDGETPDQKDQRLRKVFSDESGVPGDFERKILDFIREVQGVGNSHFVATIKSSLLKVIHGHPNHPKLIDIVEAAIPNNFGDDDQIYLMAVIAIDGFKPEDKNFDYFARKALDLISKQKVPDSVTEESSYQILRVLRATNRLMEASEVGSDIEGRSAREVLRVLPFIWEHRDIVQKGIENNTTGHAWVDDFPVEYLESVRDRAAQTPNSPLIPLLSEARERISQVSLKEIRDFASRFKKTSAPAPGA